ncbi:MAG: hypothetical protein D6751_06555 [Deltaproteobacteria bacterium]|nr:MAG: hypothetical protein D6751_06555 [Deltaproteobacteria bacterium]
MILPAGCRRQTLLRYILLQLPGTALLVLALLIIDHFRPLLDRWFWGIITLWLAKEAVLFPLTWRSYQADLPDDPLIGRTGTSVTPLDPQGTVQLGHELWQARVTGDGNISEGKPVRVTNRAGMLLEVTQSDREDGKQNGHQDG